MKELIEYLAASLVDHPDSVKVDIKESADNLLLSLSVKQEDLGKVIGKKGRTAKAMRTLLSAAGQREGKRIMLEILEPASKESKVKSAKPKAKPEPTADKPEQKPAATEPESKPEKNDG